LHHEDETHLETNPYLQRLWHRRGIQPTVPAVGTNRRLTCFGSVATNDEGRVEVLCAQQDSAAFALYLEARHTELGREIYLVLDNGPCHTSKASQAALAVRQEWLHVLWLPKYCPQLNLKEREWRRLKQDCRSHLARDLRSFVDEILVGLRHLGGRRQDIIDAVPAWFLAGHRKPPTGRPPGRPARTKDRQPRNTAAQNLHAPT
jgi:DDE superfamily endonuclease